MNQVESKFYKKGHVLVTNSAYIAHTTPLFIEEGQLKVQDIFKLKLLKFYYKLSNNFLPPYFDSYRDVINKEPPRALRQHFIHQPMIKRSYAECTPLFQLIKLINAMRRDPTDTILEIIAQNNQSYCQLSYNIKKIYLHIIQFVELEIVLYVNCDYMYFTYI